MLPLLFLVASFAPKLASACVTAHCFQKNCAYPEAVSISVQIWDNGRVVCWGGAGDESKVDQYRMYDIECFEPGITAKVSNNCGRIEYSSGGPDNYNTVLRSGGGDNFDTGSTCCRNCGAKKRQNGELPPRPVNQPQYEAVLNDGHPSCSSDGQSRPQRCDFRDFCSYQPKGPAVFAEQAPADQYDPKPPPSQSPATPGPPRDNLRIMVVGDSITHGAEGDYTWRYRIWDWFRGNGMNPTFVGPWKGTQENPLPGPPQPPRVPSDPPPSNAPKVAGGYARDASPDFPGWHFSRWGYQAAQAQGAINQMVKDHTPNLLLVLLGFNDVGWFISDADGTLNSMKLFIDNARAANPDIHFVLGNIPQRSYLGDWRKDLVEKTTRYNQLLKEAIPKWTTSRSTIYHVEIEKNFDCGPQYQPDCPAAYDGLHPNIRGEFQIAKAFSDTLHNDLKWGSGSINIPNPLPQRDLSVPQNFHAEGAPMGVKVTWDTIYGATYQVRSRIKGSSEWGVSSTHAARFDTTLTVAGVEWEYQARTIYGTEAGAWTGIVSAVARRDTAPAPKNIKIRPTGSGFDISWSPPDGGWNIDVYEIMFWDKDCNGCFISGQGARGNSASITGLTPGHRHLVWMATWTKPEGGGFYGGARPVIVGGGTPPAPSNLQATNDNPTTVQLKWDGSNGAAGYLIYIRKITDSGSESKTDGNVIMEANYGIAFLFPGTWNYEFCVTAINGDLESGKSNCVIPPKSPGY